MESARRFWQCCGDPRSRNGSTILLAQSTKNRSTISDKSKRALVIEIISNQSFIIFWIGNVRHNWKCMRHARFIFGARMNNFHYKKELPKVPKFKAYTKLYYILFSKEWNFFAHFGSFSCFLFFFLHFFSFFGKR